MTLFLLLGGVAFCTGVGLIYERWRSAESDSVSLAWLVTNEGRESRGDFEGVSIRFPIQKLQNEHAEWQTRKLRRETYEASWQRESVRTRVQRREPPVAHPAVIASGLLREREESAGREQA